MEDTCIEKLDDMHKRCDERIHQLEKNLTIIIESKNRLIIEKMNNINLTTNKAHTRLDNQKTSILCLEAWKNRQIGALVILSIIITYIAGNVKWT